MKGTNFAYALLIVLPALGCAPLARAQTAAVPDECDGFRKAVAADKSLKDDKKLREAIESSSHVARTFIWENDGWIGGGDFNYTNGMKLSWLHSPCRRRHEHEWLRGIYRNALKSLFSGAAFNVHSGGLIGMNMYTPNDLSEPNRLRNDRPYAGWVYVGWNLQAVRLLEDPLVGEEHQLELQLGFTGPKTAQREIQEYIHRNITDSTISQGWDHQIGQRLGVNALYAVRKDVLPPSYSRLRLVPHAGFSLGNLMQFVNAGGMLMLGKSEGDYPGTSIQPLRVDQRSLEFEMTESRDAEGRKTPSYVSVRPKPVWYVFGGIDARYIFSSVFVEGFGESRHDIELKHGVYDILGGVAFGTQGWRFSFKAIHRSKEFSSPDPSLEKSHRIAQASLTWFF
jgi:hypothetical protein